MIIYSCNHTRDLLGLAVDPSLPSRVGPRHGLAMVPCCVAAGPGESTRYCNTLTGARRPCAGLLCSVDLDAPSGPTSRQSTSTV